MTSATELERLVVRLVGEGKQYQKVLDDAVRGTKKAAKTIERISMRELSKQNSAMQEAARITDAVTTPTERYAKQLRRMTRLYKAGHISQETYKRALKQTTAALPAVQRAHERHNRTLQKGAAITEAARRPMEMYKRKVAEINILQRKGAISATTHQRTLARLRREYVVGSVAITAYASRMQALGGRMQMMGLMATMAVTLPVVGMIKSFVDFDSAMTKSLAIMSNVSPKMRAEMAKTAKQISLNSITSAKDLAASYYYLASAGMDAAQSLAALPVVERFAVAGAFDMALATDLLTDAQSALGLASKDAAKNMQGMVVVSDTLVSAATLANATVQQFSEALTNEAGPAIKQYNMDLNEGVAILAVYADQGLKGNAAGSMFGRMVRLVTNSINKNRQAFEKLNIPVEEFAKTGKNITAVIEGISKAVEGMGPAQKAATLQTLGFEARIQQAILPLLGATEKIKAYQAALENAGGTTKRVADEQLKALSAQLKISWNRVKATAAAIGKTLIPGLLALMGALTAVADGFRSLPKHIQVFIGIVVGAAAVLGPLSLIIGGVVKGIALMIKGIVALKAVSLPMVVGISAIVAVVWFLLDAVTKTDLGMMKWVANMKTVTGERLGTAWARIFHKISGSLHSFFVDWKITWENIKHGAGKVGHAISTALQVAWAAVGRGFTWMKNTIARGLIELFEQALHVMDAVDVLGLHTDKIKGQRGILEAWREGIVLDEMAAATRFENKMKQITAGAEARQRAYEQTILEIMDKEHDRVAGWEKRMADLEHKAFLEKLPPVLKEKPPGVGKPDAQAVWQALKKGGNEAFEGVKKAATGAAAALGDAQAAVEGVLPSVEDMAKEMGGDAATPGRAQDFRQMSLRRIGLEPVGPTIPKKQVVEDKAVAEKLDTVIQELQKKPTAVLG